MPTYEYACTACGHRLEAVQRFSDDPLTECPECGGALRKVYGAVGIVLKGSGFYRNDSRAGAGAGAASDTSNGAGSKDRDTSTSEGSSSGGEGSSSGGDGSSGGGTEKTAEKTSQKKGAKDTASAASSSG